MKCPICKSKMVNIIYGMPSSEVIVQAEKQKIFIGGCLVMENNPVYHCYNCQKSFSKDLKSSIEENDDWIK
ncbi:MAG: hypothetical protein RSE57_05625, partial [Clostridia bacterium]